MNPVDPQLFELALDHAGTTEFEKFGQSFYAAIEGTTFVPLGGAGDGGADGLSDPSLFCSSDSKRILQISKQDDHRSKIRATAARLREFGRPFSAITYLTSRVVQNSDREEDHLSDQLGVRVRIRARRYITAHVNHSAATIAAAESYIIPSIAFLKKIGASKIIPPSSKLPAQTLCVFLSQELDRRSGNTELLISVTDTLILWALDNTDPERSLFMTEGEIKQRIEGALPAAATFIKQNLHNRLEYLTRKNNTTGRQINYHKKELGYCLPYETRQQISEENKEDSVLRANVSEQFRLRLSDIVPLLPRGSVIDIIVEACHAAVVGAFEAQGLEVAAFIESNRDFESGYTLDTYVCRFLEKSSALSGRDFSLARGAALEILRQAFYESSSIERKYFQKLSRTYTLLFTLKNEPKVVEFFQQMSGKFVLYVGSDIIIRALSEHYLKPEDQMTRNLLRILKEARSKLILSEKTLGEVLGNLRKSKNEFEFEWRQIDNRVDLAIASQAPLILLRSYFYSRLVPVRGDIPAPKSFREYVEQFVSYESLRRDSAADELREYICKSFGMEFEPFVEAERTVDAQELADLTEKIKHVRFRQDNQELLARNDALQILRVYSRRKIMGERPGSNPFGFSTWWLTQESQVLKATDDVQKRYSSKFIIRPEFLVSFIGSSPSCEEVRRSFNDVFPTLLGVRLSNRMKEHDFKKIITEANKALCVDDARAEVMLSQLSDKIKSDTARVFDQAFEEPVAPY